MPVFTAFDGLPATDVSLNVGTVRVRAQRSPKADRCTLGECPLPRTGAERQLCAPRGQPSA